MGRSKVAGRPCKKCGYREGLDPAPEAPPVFEIARLEAICALQQAAFDQLFQELDEMEGGFLARVRQIVTTQTGREFKERKPCG